MRCQKIKRTLKIKSIIIGRLWKMRRILMTMMMLLGFDCMFMILGVSVVRFSHK